MFRLTLALKFSLLVILAVIITAGMIGTSLVTINISALTNISGELHQTIALSTGETIKQRVANVTVLLLQTATTLGNTSMNEESLIQIISDALGVNELTQSLGIYDRRGELIDMFIKGKKTSLPKQLPGVFITHNTPSEAFVGKPQRFITVEGKESLPVIPLVIPWYSGGKHLGFVASVIENEELCTIVSDVSARAFSGIREQVYSVDDSLHLIACYDQHRLEKKEKLQNQGVFSVLKVQSGVLPQEIIGASVEYKGKNFTGMLGTFIPIPSLNIIIVVEETQAVAYRSVDSMKNRIIMWGMVSIIAGIMLSVFIARQFTKPVNELTNASKSLAKQNFTARLPENRSDEFGVLFSVHNYVVDELYKYHQLNINRIISERNKLEAVVRQASDGIFIVDRSWQILMVNTTFTTWFSLNPETAENKPLHEVLGESFSGKQLIDHLMEASISELNVVPVELTVQVVGYVGNLILRGSMVKIQVENSIAALMLILRDVTKEVEIDKMKTELVSIVAHELRSPLNSIVGMGELIAEGALEQSETMEFAEKITKQAKLLNGIITKFLDLNKIESGKTEFRQLPVRLDEICTSMLKINMRLADKKRLQVKQQFPIKTTPILADPDLIGLAMLNLFSNSVKYSPEDTTVTVEIVEKKETITFCIHDEGYGISELGQKKLFTKFFRASDDDRIRDVPGTGLGLAFVKEVIEKHRGEVGVNSTLNKGSTFWFILPK